MPLVLILQDKTTGVQVVLEPGLPDEAFEQLLVFDLAAIRRGPLHYDQRRRQWRAELDEATALHLRHTELLGGPCRSAQALPSNLHYGSSGFGFSLLMTARSSPRSPIAAEWLRTMAGSGQPDDNAVVFLLCEQFRGMTDDEEANRWPRRQPQRTARSPRPPDLNGTGKTGTATWSKWGRSAPRRCDSSAPFSHVNLPVTPDATAR